MFFIDLFRALQEENVAYLIVGGLALNLHGVERSTMDVDLALAMDEENLRRFLRAAGRLDLRPTLPVPLDALVNQAMVAEWVAKRNMIAFSLRSPLPATPTVDVLVTLPLPFADMYGRRVEKSIGAIAVSLAGIDDLIALKSRTGREIDRSDVEALGKLKRVLEDRRNAED